MSTHDRNKHSMSLYRWNIVNADDEIIDTVSASRNDSKIAYEKLKFKYPKGHYFLKLVKVRKKGKSKGLSCDVELGGIKDAAILTKYGTLIMVGGGLFYFFWKYGSFKFFKNFGKNVKTIAKAPGEFSTAEGDVIAEAVFQVDKMMGMIKDREGESSTYKKFMSEWGGLKNEARSAEKKKIGFSEFYIADKTKKEQMANKLGMFRSRVLNYLRTVKDNYSVSGMDYAGGMKRSWKEL